YNGDLSGKWCTIYNGIDVEKFNKRVQDENVPDFRSQQNISNGPMFLSVGRYVPAKAQEDLITAMSHLVDDQPDAKLFMIGWGTREDELRQMVEKNGLTENIRVTGRVA